MLRSTISATALTFAILAFDAGEAATVSPGSGARASTSRVIQTARYNNGRVRADLRRRGLGYRTISGAGGYYGGEPVIPYPIVDPIYEGDARYWDYTGYGGFRGARPGPATYDAFGATRCSRTLRKEESYGLVLRREDTCR